MKIPSFNLPNGVLAVLRSLAAVAAVAVSLANVDSLPASVRSVLLAGGTAILAIDHQGAKPPKTPAA